MSLRKRGPKLECAPPVEPQSSDDRAAQERVEAAQREVAKFEKKLKEYALLPLAWRPLGRELEASISRAKAASMPGEHLID